MNSEEFLASQLAGLKGTIQGRLDEILQDFEEFHSKSDLSKIEVLSWVLDNLDRLSFRYSRRLENK
mgnify:FL=1